MVGGVIVNNSLILLRRNCFACTLFPSVTWTKMDLPESYPCATRIGKKFRERRISVKCLMNYALRGKLFFCLLISVWRRGSCFASTTGLSWRATNSEVSIWDRVGIFVCPNARNYPGSDHGAFSCLAVIAAANTVKIRRVAREPI